MERKDLQVTIEPMAALEEYEQVPISYWVGSRLRRDGSVVTVNRYHKDYDRYPDDRPSAYPQRFEVSNWITVVARHNGRRVGGAIVAWRSPDFDMLEGRDDLAVVADLRVSEEYRGRGVGRRLMQAAIKWAVESNCREIRVETQDTNVLACRFYESLGFMLCSWQENGYGIDINESKLIWAKVLSS